MFWKLEKQVHIEETHVMVSYTEGIFPPFKPAVVPQWKFQQIGSSYICFFSDGSLALLHLKI